MISTTLLTDIADFVNNEIAKIVINSSYVITAFQKKQVSESTVILEYIVPYGSVENVTKIEIKNIDDAILSSNDVYIPITADQLITQRVVVKEG